MSIVQYSLDWCRGEITEAFAIGTAGVIVGTAAAAFATFGETPNARSLVLPFLLFSVLTTSASAYGIWNNNQRITRFQEAIAVDAEAFVRAEVERVESFDAIFRVTFPSGAFLVVAGLVLFFIAAGPNAKAAGLTMVMLGLTALFVDHFAYERAEVYRQQLTSHTDSSLG